MPSVTRTCFVSCLLSLAIGPAADAQFDTTSWRFVGDSARVETVAGRPTLRLRDALAYLPTARFRVGTIEFDVNMPNAVGFVGIQFRMEGAGDYEDFYFRPMNSGAPDATQYQPVVHGNTGWQIYVGPRYTAALDVHHDRWMRVKLVVDDHCAAVYVDSDTIAQYIPRLLGPKGPGIIALYSNFTGARFRNVRIDTTRVAVPIRQIAESPTPSGIIARWRVSQVISENVVANKLALGVADLRPIRWIDLSASERGIVNLGVAGPRSRDTNTVLASVVIRSDAATQLPFRLGFSDRARVYLNGQLIYLGDDTFQSRDQRFLGTVGLHDTIVLPLIKGENTLIVAVSESSGGWAVTGAFDPTPGVSVSPRTP
jgi:hypothetical protein